MNPKVTVTLSDANEDSMPQANDCCFGEKCERPNARYKIEQRIEQLHRRAEQLQDLLDALPCVLPPEADEALWELVVRAEK